MRPFILTLAALIVLNLVTPACTPAQSATQKGDEETVAGAQKDAEAAVKAAQKQAEAAQAAAEQAIRQQEKVKTLILPSTGVFTSASPLRATILVIPVDQIKPEDLAAITEDISVMCRVFDKKLKEEMGIAAPARAWIGFPFGQTTETEGIYLEGYGTLFLLKVDMPLMPPPETKEEQPKEEGDPFWEETKRELHSTKEGEGFGFGGYGGSGAMLYSYGLDDKSGEKYDAEKVDRLKTSLVKLLKHAANIRNLKPDESVIISVRGGTPAVAVQKSVVNLEGHGREERSSGTRSISVRPTPGTSVHKTVSEDGFVASTVLTIRAKKSDIDAFSKGELTFDQFRQKVRINIY